MQPLPFSPPVVKTARSASRFVWMGIEGSLFIGSMHFRRAGILRMEKVRRPKKWYSQRTPSRERVHIYPTKREKENHRLKYGKIWGDILVPWKVHPGNLPKNTKNDGLEDVSSIKNGYFGVCQS